MSRSKRNAAAEEYFKRAPNYSADAVRDMRELAAGFRRNGMDGLASAHTQAADLIESAHKFALPAGGELFQSTEEWMVDQLRPPFDRVAFEFEDEKGRKPPLRHSSIDGGTGLGFPRYWIVCAEWKDGMAQLFSVFSTDAGGRTAWTLSPGWLLFLSPSFVAEPDDAAVAGSLGRYNMWASEDEYLEGWPSVAWMLQDMVRRGLATDWLDAIGVLGTKETRVAAQTCAALACTNVTTDVIRPNREARAARPASTLFDYHVLMIRPGAEHATSEDHGGTHASPRTHLRRGHIRRLAWGPRIWVNSCVVNPSAIGTVNKDYRVKG